MIAGNKYKVTRKSTFSEHCHMNLIVHTLWTLYLSLSVLNVVLTVYRALDLGFQKGVVLKYVKTFARLSETTVRSLASKCAVRFDFRIEVRLYYLR